MVHGCSAGCLFVGIRSSLHSVRFGQLLRCAHKCIVNIMKVYIDRNSIQVELKRFHKKNRLCQTIKVRNFLDGRVYENWLISIHDVSTLFCESLEMDSEGRIIEVVLGTEFSDCDRRTGDNKTRRNIWCRQFAWKVGPSANSVRYSSLRL